MGAALLTEFRKFTSTRLWWVMLIVMVGYLAFVSVFMSFGLTGEGQSAMGGDEALLPTGADAARTAYSIGNPIGYVFPLIIGSLAFTGEFRHQTITASLLVEPRRSLLLVAKLISSVAIGLAYGVVGTLAVVGSSAPVLAGFGDGAYLGDSEVQKVIVFSVLVLTIWAVVGVAIGGFITNQVAAIVVIVAFTQFVEPIARFVGATVDSLSGFAQYLPGAAADAIMGASFLSSVGAEVDLLPRWAGALILLGYAALFALLARFVTLRKDIA